MKTQHHTIVIDAQAAFQTIGVNLDDSPIGGQCLEALKVRLIKSITSELLLQSMMDAAKRPKAMRGQRKPDSQVEPKTGGPTHHEA